MENFNPASKWTMQEPFCFHHYKIKGIITFGLILSPATFKFHSPMSIATYAPPYSGKSILTRKILEHGDELFTTSPSCPVYYYKEWLPMFDKMKHTVKGLILHKGAPS